MLALTFALASLASIGLYSPEARAASCEATSDGIAFANIDTLGAGLQHSVGKIEVKCDDIQAEPASVCLKASSVTLNDDGTQWTAEFDIYAFVSKDIPDSRSGFYTGSFSIDVGAFEGGSQDCSGTPAGSSNSSVDVTATVQDDCNIHADDIDFGDVGLIDTAVRRTGKVYGRCTLGTSYRIDLGDGVNGTRRMISPGGDHLTYEFYQDPSYSQRWGVEDQGVSADTPSSGSGEYDHSIYAELPVQPAAVGKYADTVTATIIYGSSLP